MTDVDKIYLVGFMGAGKSTVARALAARLSWQVEDIDERIEARERLTVADIFRIRGELYFRALERDALRALLPARHVVVATGGGTFADPDARALMLADGLVIWIDAPLDVVIERVPTDGRRPLAMDRAQFEQLYCSRRRAYQQAHLRFESGRGPLDELVERVLDRLGW